MPLAGLVPNKMSSCPRVFPRTRYMLSNPTVIQTSNTGSSVDTTKAEEPKTDVATSEEPKPEEGTKEEAKGEEAKPEEAKQEEQPAATGEEKKEEASQSEGGEKRIMLSVLDTTSVIVERPDETCTVNLSITDTVGSKKLSYI